MSSKDVLEVDESTGTAVVVEKADPKKAKLDKAKKQRLERLAVVEDELMDEATEVLRGAHRFTEIAPDATEPPEHWITEYGPERAQRMLRAAQAAWVKTSDAPMGLKLASMTFGAIVKARAAKDSQKAPKLNVAVVQLTQGPSADFPVLKVEK